ncbi:GGDEF domain-containing protein [Deinococcus cellulosilyticus]|uniref:GGDEF domain-containing protein n=1 Tax=Deinococcus cellulosilyticus (strain DSM 18568 / NBRC 106333 / KACC 11606 / 5516J-15) TaxID=1223518 RepID=A0A511N099_DEIC1|nr:GGDEF domain-containing protein [Deinococcus cellulosilyticus]GEM45806.1 hypothetical protein DC3_14410 [Deinococcus cellulosilyticus NBRC 106333 = KACC 11606]
MMHKTLSQRILDESVDRLYEQVRQSVVVTFIAILLFASALYHTQPLLTLYWALGMLLHSFFHAQSVFGYPKVRHFHSTEHWLVREFSYTITLGMGWAIFTMIYFRPEATEDFYLMLVFIVAVVSGSVVTYAAVTLIYPVMVCFILIPLTLRLALTAPQHEHHVFLALGFLIYTGVLIKYHQQAHAISRKAIELYLQQGILLEELHRFKEQLQVSNEQLTVVNGHLQSALGRSHRLAFNDALTGCFNRRAFVEHLRAYASPYAQAELCVIMMDLDHFKRINDQKGHLFGDHVLKVLAARIQMQLRPDDILARYGGEEFVCLLPGTSLAEARDFAETIRKAVAGTPIRDDQHVQHITISMGVAKYLPPEDPQETVNRADQALYRAKREGRDRVVVT